MNLLFTNDYFDEKAIIVNITEMSLIYEIERMVTETEDKFIIQKKRKGTLPKKQPLNPIMNSEIEEVDLHIEQLTDNFSGLSNSEIMDIQMSKFSIALEGAIRNNVKKIVFIHGVGNGKLKYEIRKTLDSKYPKLHYQDASFMEYGYGATMVMIK
jgi:dsDNA-specific endonuclease/ATPase MutS2